MPRHAGKHVVLVKGAEAAMEAFKQEIASDLGLLEKMGPDRSYKNLSTVEVGNIGGEMVRRMQAAGEYSIMQRYKAGEPRLLPEEILPDPNGIRGMSNNGNIIGQSGEILTQMDESTLKSLLQSTVKTNAVKNNTIPSTPPDAINKMKNSAPVNSARLN